MAKVGGDYRGHRRLSVFRSARVNRVRAALLLLVLSGGERHESRYLAALLAGGCGCGGRLFARRHNGAIIPRRRDQRPVRPASRTVRPARIPRAEPGGTTH